LQQLIRVKPESVFKTKFRGSEIGISAWLKEKNSLKLLFLIVFACFIGLVGIGFFALHETFSNMCGNEVYQEVLEPGNRFKAILFQRDCGATTGFSTQISLISVDDKLPNNHGNIFIANGHPKDTNIEMHWLAPAKLLVRHTVGLSVKRKEKLYKGISISYE
jgi:hypothetical protein